MEAYLKKLQEVGKSDPSVVTRLMEGVQDYLVTNMGTDHFADLLEASMNGETTIETLPGEGTEGEYFDEYHVDARKPRSPLSSSNSTCVTRILPSAKRKHRRFLLSRTISIRSIYSRINHWYCLLLIYRNDYYMR